MALHTGAMERVDFGEENDPRGCYIVDTETGEATWNDLPVRRFWTWNVNDDEVAALANGEKYALYDRSVFAQDTICRIRYRATEEQARQIDNGRLIRILEESGAYHIAGVYPEIIRSDRARAQGVTEETTPLMALDTWLDLRSDLTLDLKADVRAAAQMLVQEVQ
jgi:exonuclease SbcD